MPPHGLFLLTAHHSALLTPDNVNLGTAPHAQLVWALRLLSSVDMAMELAH